MESHARRIVIESDPFPETSREPHWARRGIWPVRWVGCAGVAVPFVAAFRLPVHVGEDTVVRAHVTADERYELYLNGIRVGRGSERGDARNWFYETYELSLTAGEHMLTARVWALGDLAPLAQHSVRPGFLLAAEGEWTEVLSTGRAPWEAKAVAGYGFEPPRFAFGVGHKFVMDGERYPQGAERGEGEGWQPVVDVGPAINARSACEGGRVQMLRPAMLSAMVSQPVTGGKVRFVGQVDSDETEGVPVRLDEHLADEAEGWQKLLNGESPLVLMPGTQRRLIIDLDEYYCAYPSVVTTGGKGSALRMKWAESLYVDPIVQHDRDKGNRDEIDGKYFCGVGDTFKPGGGERQRLDTLWWQAGRYIELVVMTGEQTLTMEGVELEETRYPLEMTSRFESSDDRLEAVVPVMFRTMQMCSHETYMDCPYYEQLMYVGDTRMEVLTTYVSTTDGGLPRKAIEMFGASRVPSGVTQSRYPCRATQFIPPFSLWWIGMVHDYALWRGERELVSRMMPGVRGVIDAFLGWRGEDGLVRGPQGWNYMDWAKVEGWARGVPPEGEFGASGVINWQFALVLTYAAKLERWVGDEELAQRCERLAGETARVCHEVFWDDARGLFADTVDHEHYSEHTQCLALLSGLVEDAKRDRVAEGLLTAEDLTRTTIYFTHYLFETYALIGRTDALLARMPLWFEHLDKGMRTTIEAPEPTRSDCHAWGAHPIYHYFASLLGIRPAGMGFEAVVIQPQPGPLAWARGTMVHPRGEIRVEAKREDGSLKVHAQLPEGMSGAIMQGGRQVDRFVGEAEVVLAE